MTFVLVQIDPFVVLETLFPTSIPDPIVWPDGTASHGVPPTGMSHGNWAVLPAIYTPPSPGEFYTLAESVGVLTGQTVTFTQTWTPQPLAGVQATLVARLNQAAEQQRQAYITAGPGQAMIYLQKLAEATALMSDAAPVAANYPLLNATVGIEAPTLAAVGALVRQTSAQWTLLAAQIEAARLSTKAAITAAATVDPAVAALAAVTWPAGPNAQAASVA